MTPNLLETMHKLSSLNLTRKENGSVENAGCGVRSAECRVWRMRSEENEECGKCGVWIIIVLKKVK